MNKKRIILIMLKVLILIIIFYLLIFYVFGFHIVKSNNMMPNIKPGSVLIIYKLDKYNLGDVILTNNNQIYRLIGMNKDKIEIENNIVLVNSDKEEGDIYFSTYKNESSNIVFPYIVKKDEYFVLNDYRIDYSDSRTFGSLKKNDIKGKVIAAIQIRGF